MSPQVVILAGGLARRLGSLTKEKPKSLILINNIPFIIHQLDYLKKQGIQKIHLCLGHFSDQILELLSKYSNLDLEISYSIDGDKQLGTGGAIKKALSFCEDNFFIQYGDTFLPINYIKVYEYFKALPNRQSIMCIYKNNNLYDNSNIIYQKNKIFKYDKNNFNEQMNYIDYGLSFIVKKDLLKYLNKDIIDLSEIYIKLIKEKMMMPYEVTQRFYEIGKIEGIKDTEYYLNLLEN